MAIARSLFLCLNANLVFTLHQAAVIARPLKSSSLLDAKMAFNIVAQPTILIVAHLEEG
jgi:hypothetical protein